MEVVRPLLRKRTCPSRRLQCSLLPGLPLARWYRSVPLRCCPALTAASKDVPMAVFVLIPPAQVGTKLIAS